MTKTSEIVERAYQKLGILSRGDALTGAEVNDGVTALNQMIHAWKLAGVDTTHTDIAATDDFPLAPEFEEGTVYVLASRLSPDFEVPQMFDADDWFRKIQAAYMVIDDVVMPSSILHLPSRRRRYF